MNESDVLRIYRNKIISPYMCVSDMHRHRTSADDYPSFQSYMLALINELLIKRPGAFNSDGLTSVQNVLDEIKRIYEQEQIEKNEQLQPTPYDDFFKGLTK